MKRRFPAMGVATLDTDVAMEGGLRQQTWSDGISTLA
jgi:hypothetical protein